MQSCLQAEKEAEKEKAKVRGQHSTAQHGWHSMACCSMAAAHVAQLQARTHHAATA